MKLDNGIAAIVLAAGSSSRMRGEDKLMMTIEGEPLLCRAIKNICASDISKCFVVVRSEPEKYRALLDDLDVEIIHEPNAHEGMSVSMKAGIEAAGNAARGYMICLGDMPDLTLHHFNQVISKFLSDGLGKIIRPKTDDGRFGHPVLFDQCYYDDLKKMSGDEGARALIKREHKNVLELVMDEAILLDLDTPEAWIKWQDRSNSED